MINIPLIVSPLVGALIGYITNDFAIWMLFHPYEPVYLFGHKIPFTPGLIPREKDRMAASISQMISEKLMTEDVLRENLLSDEVISKIERFITEFAKNLQAEQKSLREKGTELFGEENVTEFENKTASGLTDLVSEKITESDLGYKLAVLAKNHIKQKFGMIGEIGIDIFAPNLPKDINTLIKENAKPIAGDFIKKGVKDILNAPISILLENKDEQIESLKNGIIRLYKNTINERLPQIIEGVNIQLMVENKIKAMEVKEMEDLIFGIMDKELKSIVRLGAGLGFLMGFLTYGLNQLMG